MMTRPVLVLPVLALACALAASPAVAHAEDAGAPAPAASTAVAAEVKLLHATNDGSGIDPKIGKMPELVKPPFSSYNSYRLLDTAGPKLAKGVASTVTLPNGRTLMLTLKDVVVPKQKGEPKKYQLNASIDRPDGKAVLPLLEVNTPAGSWIMVAGQSYKGGVLVIGIRIAE
jgi:hypothetical protein